MNPRWSCSLGPVCPKGAESGLPSREGSPMNQLAEVQAVLLQFPPGGSHHFEKAPFLFQFLVGALSGAGNRTQDLLYSKQVLSH